jgi:DNA-directed RNA polymerase specialized sigma24 family protein
VTRLLEEYRAGDREAFQKVVALVYDDLRRIARRRLQSQGGGRILDTTELVHEAYIRLGAQSSATWENRPTDGTSNRWPSRSSSGAPTPKP